MRLFNRFDQDSANEMQNQSYNWLFNKLALNPITLDVKSTVTTPRRTVAIVTIRCLRLWLIGDWLQTFGYAPVTRTQQIMRCRLLKQRLNIWDQPR